MRLIFNLSKEIVAFYKILQIRNCNISSRIHRSTKSELDHIIRTDFLCRTLHLLRNFRIFCHSAYIHWNLMQLTTRKVYKFVLNPSLLNCYQNKALWATLIETASFQTTGITINSLIVQRLD